MVNTPFRITRPVLLLALLVALPGVARAADINEVTTAFEPKNPYDFRFRIAYHPIIEHTALNREYMGNGPGIEVVKDLVFKQITHQLDLRAEFAIYKDFGIYLSLPVILRRQAKYEFAGGDRYHMYPGETDCRDQHPSNPWVCNPDGVNANNSRFVQDGLATGLSGFGYDPTTNTVNIPSDYAVTNGDAGPRELWRGPARAGVDQLHLGIHGLIMSERRHSSYPNWRFGAEFRLGVGKVMDFKRNPAGDPESCQAPSQNDWLCRPELNNAVGKGIHEIRFFTTASKYAKLWTNGGIDSFIHIWFQMPMAYRNSSFYAKRYDFSGDYGEESVSPVIKAPMKAGVHFGAEFVAWEKPAKGYRVSFELRGLLEGHFDGRDYSQAYELLAGSPTLNLNCDPAQPNYANIRHYCEDTRVRDRLLYFPGITQVENFARFGLKLGIHILIAKYVKLSLLYALVHEQEHLITTDDAGIDNGTTPLQGGVCPAGSACPDGLINIGTNEQNPWHRPVIHQAGHRIRAQETLIHHIWINAKLMF